MEINPFPPKKPSLMRSWQSVNCFWGYLKFLVMRRTRRYGLRWEMMNSAWIYSPLLEKAENQGKFNEAEEIYGEWSSLDRLTRDSLAALESSDLIPKAKKYQLSPFDIQAPAHWQEGVVGRYLHDDVTAGVKKAHCGGANS